MNGQASDYWYWDGTEIWDSNPVRAANQAINNALSIAQSGTDNTPPAVYLPQREPYNPGAVEWDGVGVMPSDFTVWTYVFDLSGLQSVQLKYRLSGADQVVQDNLTYAGGATVEAWQSLPMEGVSIASVTDPQPLFKAQEFSAEIVGLESVLVDYYVEAIDQQGGNIAKSPIQHVWVGRWQRRRIIKRQLASRRTKFARSNYNYCYPCQCAIEIALGGNKRLAAACFGLLA